MRKKDIKKLIKIICEKMSVLSIKKQKCCADELEDLIDELVRMKQETWCDQGHNIECWKCNSDMPDDNIAE